MNFKSHDTRKPHLTSKNHQRPSGRPYGWPNISTTELKPSSLEKKQHYVSRNVAGAKVKACWGKDTIWAILSNLWNHEFSSYQQVLCQNLLPSGVKAGTKTDDATRSGPNMFQLQRIPVLDLSPTVVRRVGGRAGYHQPSPTGWLLQGGVGNSPHEQMNGCFVVAEDACVLNWWNRRSHQLRTKRVRTRFEPVASFSVYSFCEINRFSYTSLLTIFLVISQNQWPCFKTW